MKDVEYLESIISPLVNHPEEILCGLSEDDRGTLIEVEVAVGDVGRVVGKGGTTANAIRLLMKVFGAKTNQRISVKINERK